MSKIVTSGSNRPCMWIMGDNYGPYREIGAELFSDLAA